tara:strand:+ start:12856 stop:13461 length:606 start_codon:yes stop_codon:yes gene_type:complete
MKQRYTTQKAAMFGLDARIALAIFGALSVISGAALYSAIQQAKVISFMASAREVAKAWEQYYLDTGKSIPPYDTNPLNSGFHSLKTAYLVNSNSISGWKGPYLSFKSNGDTLDYPEYGNAYLMRLTNETWNTWSLGGCSSGKNCYIWTTINGISDESLALALDNYIDSSDGDSDGDFRWRKYNTDYYEYLMKQFAIQNPND